MAVPPRIQQILLLLLGASSCVTEQEIADTIGVSKRTVQRDLDEMEEVLTSNDLKLSRRKNLGLCLEGSEEAKKKLKEALGSVSEPDVSNKEERRKHLLFELLRDRTPRKLYYYSQLLDVSEATIGSDMEALAPWLEQNHLSINKRQGYGVVLTGTEANYREAMRRFIHENMDNRLYRLPQGDEALTKVLMNATEGGIYSLLSNDTVNKVFEALQNLEEPKLKSLAENAYIGLIFHIAIAVDRIQKGSTMEEGALPMNHPEAWEDYELAKRILEAIEEEFEIAIPEVELSYILLHIRGAKIGYSGSVDAGEKLSIGGEELLKLVDEMMNAYDTALVYELKCDEEFVRGLVVHLQPVFVRLQNHLNIFNPILEEIKTEYPKEFEKSRHAAEVITKHTGFTVGEEEIGYLTMHFGAAEERIRERHVFRRKVVIGIVCASGFGVARLMMTKLSFQLGERVMLRAYGREEITPYVISTTDFFITTMNMDQEGADYIRVSPLISAADLAHIECKIEDYAHVRRSNVPERNVPGSVTPTGIEENDFSRQLDAANFITREIKGLIRRYRKYEADADFSFAELVYFLAEQVTESAAAAGLVAGEIEERERLNTQIFPELGICLLHCRTKAVRDAMIVTCTPAGREGFRNPYFKGIRAAILMLMPMDGESQMHAEILGHVSSSLVHNHNFVQAILYGEEEQVRTELQRELKTYFYEFLNQI